RRHEIAAGLPEPMHSARLAQTLRVAVLRSGMHGPRDGGRHGASDAPRSPTLRWMTVSTGACGNRQARRSPERPTGSNRGGGWRTIVNSGPIWPTLLTAIEHPAGSEERPTTIMGGGRCSSLLSGRHL